MENFDKLREIEDLGLGENEDDSAEEASSTGSGWAPVVQALVCLVLLLALLLLRYLDEPTYSSFAEWYHQESSREIQLPGWGVEENNLPALSPSPSLVPTPSPTPDREGDPSLQRV